MRLTGDRIVVISQIVDDRLLILLDLERVLSDEEIAQVAAVGEMHG